MPLLYLSDAELSWVMFLATLACCIRNSLSDRLSTFTPSPWIFLISRWISVTPELLAAVTPELSRLRPETTWLSSVLSSSVLRSSSA